MPYPTVSLAYIPTQITPKHYIFTYIQGIKVMTQNKYILLNRASCDNISTFLFRICFMLYIDIGITTVSSRDYQNLRNVGWKDKFQETISIHALAAYIRG